MAEELRITLDEAGAGARAPAAGAVRAPSTGVTAPRGAGGIGAAGLAATAVVASVGVASAAIGKFAKTVEQQTNDLAGLSGPIASAQAQTQIRREFARLRRAQAIGPELARAERARAAIEERLFDINTQILEVLLKMFDFSATNWNAIVQGIAVANPVLGQILNQITIAVANQEESFEDDIFNQQFKDLFKVESPIFPDNAPGFGQDLGATL